MISMTVICFAAASRQTTTDENDTTEGILTIALNTLRKTLARTIAPFSHNSRLTTINRHLAFVYSLCSVSGNVIKSFTCHLARAAQ
jgi:hypothetical protein